MADLTPSFVPGPSTRDWKGLADDAREISADMIAAADVLSEIRFLRLPWAIRGARRSALDIARSARKALDALIDGLESGR